MLAAGTRLGPYEILAPLGAGGMGEVYRARDSRLDRDVALKLLPEAVARDPERVARFEREAKALAVLSHPNLLAIHDVGREGGIAFAVTELLEGETLRERIARERLPWSKAVEIAAAIADGLASAHAHGIVHRDVKPENVFLTTDGRVKVLDFGLARLEAATAEGDSDLPTLTSPSPQTRAGAVVGTVGYMSPEQVKGQPADHRSDLFALGLVLHEMLAGKRAFARETAAETMTAILREPAPALHLTGSDAPPGLARVVTRCLEKAPGERFQSASDLAFNLRAIVTHDTADHASVPSRAPARWARRRLWMGALALLSTLSAAVFVWQRGRSPGPAAPAVGPVPTADAGTVSVAVFENRTGDPALDPTGRLIADALVDGLGRVGRVKVMTPKADGGGPPGAGLAVSGAYYIDAGALRVQARLDDAVAGRLVHALEPVIGSRERAGDLLEPLRQRVMGLVASYRDGLDPALTRPPTFAAYQEYLRGLEPWGQDWAAVVRHLEAALALAPDSFRAREMLFWAVKNQGLHEKAAEVLAAQESRSRAFTPWEQQKFAGERAMQAGQIEQQLSATRAALEIGPSEHWDRCVVAALELWLNRPRAVLQTLAPLPRDWMPRGVGDASLPMRVRADAHHFLGEFDRQLATAEECAAAYRDDPFCRRKQVGALAALGRGDEIGPLIDRIAAVQARRGSVGDVLEAATRELRAHGQPAAALAFAAREVELRRREVEAEPHALWTRRALAFALAHAERWDEAEGLLAGLHREDPLDLALAGMLGIVYAARGRVQDVERLEAELSRLSRPYLYGERSYWQAAVAAWRGRKAEAVVLLRQAFAEGLPYGITIRCGFDLSPLQGYPPFEELTRPKG